jgi:dynactin 1
MIEIGSRVFLNNSPGTVRFIGVTQFAIGNWVGVELDLPTGKNDGSVNGIRYFNCKLLHGVFQRINTVQLYTDPDTDTERVLDHIDTGIHIPSKIDLLSDNTEKFDSSDTVATISIGSTTPKKENEFIPATTIPTTPSSSSSLTTPTKDSREVDQLKLKIRILESQRLQDKSRLKELEHLRTELQSSHILNEKISLRLTELQSQLRDSNSKIKELENTRQESNVDELNEMIELLTIDKEYAQEQADFYKEEIDTLKDKIEELTIDLEVLKNEKGTHSSAMN